MSPSRRWVSFLCALCLIADFGTRAAAPLQRIPWNSSHLVGSPEPSLPYTVEKTFTNLTWKRPMYVADEPGTNLLWVVLQGGESNQPSRLLRIVDDPATAVAAPMLELPGRLIYGIAFHPGFVTNHFLYVFNNGPTPERERTNCISRFTVSDRVDLASERRIIQWRSAGHDGGDLAFGLDSMLYITSGDGTSDSDGWVSGQTVNDLLGAVLRIDVDHPTTNQLYRVPADNPFVHLPGACPEIWAYGLRNPWRMGIDSRSGRVWVGNNGQDAWETAQLIGRGENYGWSVYEGSHPFYLNRPRGPTPHVLPTIEHSHSEFRSLTGGVVYYGDKFPDLNGVYIYGDYSSGRIWGMKHDGVHVEWHRELADSALQIAAFRVDQRGHLLIVDHGGGIYRLARAPVEAKSLPAFPRRLSETGLFRSVADDQLAPGVLTYSVNAPAWMDGAGAERFLALPGETRIEYSRQAWNFPEGTVLGQTLTRAAGPGERADRLETRLLLRQQGEWEAYSYRWNAGQTDAELVGKAGTNFTRAGGPDWHVPSRAECMACHSRAANFVLGLNEAQMNRDHDYAGVRTNQVDGLAAAGLFEKKPAPASQRRALTNPYLTSAPLEARARAYLQVNCSVCHVEAGGGNSRMDLSITADEEHMNLFSARPQHDSFGIVNAMLIAPGAPDRSILLRRLSHRGPGQMPPLGSIEVDTAAIALFREWIAQMPPTQTLVHEWTLAELLPFLDQTRAGRSFAAGRAAFQQVGCGQCHRFGGEGGSVGPDLTGVSRRLLPRQILESIIEPSNVIADGYATHRVELVDGHEIEGRIENETEANLTIRAVSTDAGPLTLPISQIKSRARSPLSNMPAGMVNVLQRDQILDLLAYLLSEGDPAGVPFQP